MLNRLYFVSFPHVQSRLLFVLISSLVLPLLVSHTVFYFDVYIIYSIKPARSTTDFQLYQFGLISYKFELDRNMILVNNNSVLSNKIIG